jgi:hypothetical protein
LGRRTALEHPQLLVVPQNVAISLPGDRDELTVTGTHDQDVDVPFVVGQKLPQSVPIGLLFRIEFLHLSDLRHQGTRVVGSKLDREIIKGRFVVADEDAAAPQSRVRIAVQPGVRLESVPLERSDLIDPLVR